MLEYDDKQWRTMKHTLLGLKLFLWSYIAITAVLFVEFVYSEFRVVREWQTCRVELSSPPQQDYD